MIKGERLVAMGEVEYVARPSHDVAGQPSRQTGNSVMSTGGAIRPTFGGSGKLGLPSVNQRFPCEPGVMYLGKLLGVGTGNCLSPRIGATRAVEGIVPCAIANPTTSASRRRIDGRRFVSIAPPYPPLATRDFG